MSKSSISRLMIWPRGALITCRHSRPPGYSVLHWKNDYYATLSSLPLRSGGELGSGKTNTACSEWFYISTHIVTDFSSHLTFRHIQARPVSGERPERWGHPRMTGPGCPWSRRPGSQTSPRTRLSWTWWSWSWRRRWSSCPGAPRSWSRTAWQWWWRTPRYGRRPGSGQCQTPSLSRILKTESGLINK